MLRNEWPGKGCEFCRDVEVAGGNSDRIAQLTIPNFPIELETNVTTRTIPTTVEVYFDNKCNLSCVYCHAGFSSKILHENKKFGKFPKGVPVRNELLERDKNSAANKELFWEWMTTHSQNVANFNILGGEPFIQDDFDVCLRFFNENPRPNLTLTVVSNLMLPSRHFKMYITRLRQLVHDNKIKRLDLTASIDCWGVEQEYARFGISLRLFEENIQHLLVQGDWLRININHTITSLTINSIPELLTKINKWRETKDISQYGGLAVYVKYLSPTIFGSSVWGNKLEEIISLLPNNTYDEKYTFKLFSGIALQLRNAEVNDNEIKTLFIYLDELDRRRGTSWREVYPYLTEFV
jgi:organic radical activating enzyme